MEGLKCAPADQLLATRPHVLMRRPRVIAVGVDQHPQLHLQKVPKRYRICCASPSTADQLHLPGPRDELVGHRSWSSTNISQLHLYKLPERRRVIIVRSTNIRTFVPTVTRHSAATSPKKGCVASVSPDTPRMKKLYTYLFPSHLCLSRVLTPSPILTSDRRPPRRGRSQCRWLLTPGLGIQVNKTTRHRMPPGRTNKPNPTVDLHWSLAVCLARERRKSVVVQVDMVRKRVVVPRNKLEQTLKAAERPHSGPWLKYLWSKRN